MIALISALVLLAFGCLLGWKMDRMAQACERVNDRLCAQEMAFRSMERSANMAGEKLDLIVNHMLPAMAEEPPPLPPVPVADDETKTGRRRKRK